MEGKESLTHFYFQDANLILASSGDFYFLQNVKIPSQINTTSYIVRAGRLSPG
jgi:hypothetical protein